VHRRRRAMPTRPSTTSRRASSWITSPKTRSSGTMLL
jgi:hypothetical protein